MLSILHPSGIVLSSKSQLEKLNTSAVGMGLHEHACLKQICMYSVQLSLQT
jgi:hypothetical protein